MLTDAVFYSEGIVRILQPHASASNVNVYKLKQLDSTIYKIIKSNGMANSAHPSKSSVQRLPNVCTTTTKRVPNVHDVWNTFGSRCTTVADSLGGRSFWSSLICVCSVCSGLLIQIFRTMMVDLHTKVLVSTIILNNLKL